MMVTHEQALEAERIFASWGWGPVAAAVRVMGPDALRKAVDWDGCRPYLPDPRHAGRRWLLDGSGDVA